MSAIDETTPPPRPLRGMLLRFLAGAVVIVALTATATATAGLLQIREVVQKIASQPGGTIEAPAITRAEAGEAQTLLLLGSDRRWQDLAKNNPALEKDNPPRSDSIMLLRLDPDAAATTVLSIPRDLRVTIPGVGLRKINDAYAEGGPELTLETVKELTGLEINHVINVNFGGFKDAVNALGCVWADIDRRYFNDNDPPTNSPFNYATIDVEPGYQRMCGRDALDYVRYRHGDSDLVRAARQQNFLRAVQDQVTTSSLIEKRSELVDIFASNTQTDEDLATSSGLIQLLKLALFSADKPVRQVEFPGEFVEETLPSPASGPGVAEEPLKISYVVADPAKVQEAVDEFLDPPEAKKEEKKSSSEGGGSEKKAEPEKKKKKKDDPSLKEAMRKAGLVDARAAGQELLSDVAQSGGIGFPIRFPSALTPQGRYDAVSAQPGAPPAPRVYWLRDRGDGRHRAYRLVVVQNAREGRYYGVQGTEWRNPPILRDPDEIRRVGGRRLLLFKSGKRLRLVAWKTDRAAYWISNTLDLALENDEMLTIARSLTRYRQPPS